MTIGFMAAKQKWRNMCLDFNDDVDASIALLHCLDECSGGIVSWFDGNLQLETRKPILELVQRTIGTNKILEDRFRQCCLETYRLAVDGRG